jgi:hypothetical protein
VRELKLNHFCREHLVLGTNLRMFLIHSWFRTSHPDFLRTQNFVMGSGRPPLDPETKLARRSETRKRYAEKYSRPI